jgi:hypothetical protein
MNGVLKVSLPFVGVCLCHDGQLHWPSVELCEV